MKTKQSSVQSRETFIIKTMFSQISGNSAFIECDIDSKKYVLL